MADYIYLLENRLSSAQQSALQTVREIARRTGLTVFLVGGAVRDLTSGSPVRDLDLAIQGNALKLRKELEKVGAQISGENEPMQSLYLRFPGSVRMELSSTLDVSFPKPGKPVVHPASIQEDLRRRDFTANAMALSLNDGSYGLLMDPLNGVADIENRELRLVSNYGFIEDPARMIRAARLGARLGWQLEERTQARYETGKAEGYISALSEFQRGYELEEIVHEEDPLRVLSRLESEGWMKVLCPAWTVAKVNAAELEKLRDTQAQLQMQGILADPSAAQFPLLTAKLAPKDVASLKKLFPRRGFVAEIDALESEGKQFASELSSKAASTPSAAWRLILSAPPEVVLWVAYSTRSGQLQSKFRSFYTEWPQARQRIPYALMQEMRIQPELPGYDELVEHIFFELMDARLGTPEEMRAFLEPHSPPAPPPPVNLRRPRVAKGAKTTRSRKRTDAETEELAEARIPDLESEETYPTSEESAKPAEAAPPLAAAPAKTASLSAPAKTAARVTSSAKPAHRPPAKAAPETKKTTPAPATKSSPGKKTATSANSSSKPLSRKSQPKPSAKLPVRRTPSGSKVTKAHKPVASKKLAPAKPAKKAVTAKKLVSKPLPKVAGKAAKSNKPAQKLPLKKSGKPAPKPAKKTARPAAKLVHTKGKNTGKSSSQRKTKKR